jgi:hypothetical protein
VVDKGDGKYTLRDREKGRLDFYVIPKTGGELIAYAPMRWTGKPGAEGCAWVADRAAICRGLHDTTRK